MFKVVVKFKGQDQQQNFLKGINQNANTEKFYDYIITCFCIN